MVTSLGETVKKLKIVILPLLALALGACQSTPESTKTASELAAEASLDHPIFKGRMIYLRGEMNDFGIQGAYRLRKFDEGKYCTLAPLRSDWSPYKFKFADSAWTSGTNFGFAVPPGVLRTGSGNYQLNGKSRFEELRYEVAKDGIYRFCITIQNDVPYASVSLLEDGKLTTTEELIKSEIEREFSVPKN